MSNNAPVHKVRMGFVTASVWKNEGNDRPFYTVTLERVYKDGDEYKNTKGLNSGDLLNACWALEKAAQWISEQ